MMASADGVDIPHFNDDIVRLMKEQQLNVFVPLVFSVLSFREGKVVESQARAVEPLSGPI